MFCYYSLSALWGGDMRSAVTHSAYILLLSRLAGDAARRVSGVSSTAVAMLAGITVLCLYPDAGRRPDDLSSAGNHRLQSRAEQRDPIWPVTPAIAILLSLMIFRDTGQKRRCAFIPPLLAFMVLTQSRGPRIALAFAVVVAMPIDTGRDDGCGFCCPARWLWFSPSFTARSAKMLLTRFGELYQQSFVRIGIWRHSRR
ncbi:hypothetical protein M8494_05455 [Serratia ureilytica]